MNITKEEQKTKDEEFKKWNNDFMESKKKLNKKKNKKKKRFEIFYSDYIEMNGKGIDFIIDHENREKLSTDQGLELICEELSAEYIEFYDYELCLYIGADYCSPYLKVDYYHENIKDESKLEKIKEWLFDNTMISQCNKKIKTV